MNADLRKIVEEHVITKERLLSGVLHGDLHQVSKRSLSLMTASTASSLAMISLGSSGSNYPAVLANSASSN